MHVYAVAMQPDPPSAQRYALAAARAGRAPKPGRFTARTLQNPLYRAQLAHARIVRLLSQLDAFGVNRRNDPSTPGPVDAASREVLRLLDLWDGVPSPTPYAVTRTLDSLSQAVLTWLDDTEFWPSATAAAPSAEHETRAALAERARIVVASGLEALGIPAHERI